MKKILILTSLSLILAGCGNQESKTRPNPLNETNTPSQAESGAGSETSSARPQDVFSEVLKNAESYLNDGMNTADDKYLEYKNIKYFKIKADKEYLVLSGEQYIKGTKISSGLKAVRFFSYDSSTNKVEKSAVSGYPIQALLIGDSSKAGAYNTALREKDSNIMPRAMKGKLVQNTKGDLAYIHESMGGIRYSLDISNNKVDLEQVDSVVPGNEHDLVASGEKEVTWTAISGETEGTTSKTSEKSQFSPYVGTYKGENGSITLNEDGSITEGNQTHKPMNVTKEDGRIIIESNLSVGTLPVLLHIYPAGVKDRYSGDSSKNRILKDAPKSGAYLFTQE